MRTLARLAALIGGLFRPQALDDQVSEELRFHLDRQIEANLEAGMSPDEARRAAHVLVGSVESIREESRVMQPGAMIHQLGRDLVFGVRLLRRAPGFAAIGALVVALGVGSTTAIFSVVYGVMLRPLPYPEQERLVALWTRLPGSAQRTRANPADYREWRSSTTAGFEGIALATAPQNFNLIGSGEPERLVAGRLSSDLFSVLRISPVLGRAFTAHDEQGGNERVVLLGDGLWRRRFGADPSIVGRTINLSGIPYEVIGVMPPHFQFPEREHQLWIPLTIDPQQLTRQASNYDHLAIGRLKPGVRLEQAQREIDAITARLEAQFPATNRGMRVEVVPMLEESIRAIKPALYVMLAAVLSLLLIACLNLASLLSARAASRSREFTVRLALGASRGRLTLQALAEVAPILAIGGIAGVAAAKIALAAFVPIAPPGLPRADTIDVNGPVLAFSMVTLVLTGIVSGLLPAMQAWRANVPDAAKGTRSATATRDQIRTRHALVVAQLALTLPLLVGASALVRTFSTLMHVDPGFRGDNVLTMHMAIPRQKYRSDEQIAALYTRIVDQVAAVLGVVSAAMVNRLPLSGNNYVLPFGLENVDGEPVSLQVRSVTPDYFRTMGIPLREGRAPMESDRALTPLVGVIDERAARTFWPGQSAIGKRFHVTLPGQKQAEGRIVGIVGNVRHAGLDNEADRQMYVNYHQFTDGRIVLVVRSRSDAGNVTPAVLQALRTVDPEQPVYDVRTMDEVIARSTAQRWLNMLIVTVFAISSLVLASVGLYGVIAYGATQRMREFGVRLALGATRVDVSRLVVRKGSILAASGAALGLGGAIILALAMESLLYGVAPLDPITFAAAAGLLFGVALVASYLPARRAASTDPVQALRGD